MIVKVVWTGRNCAFFCQFSLLRP